MDAVTAYVTRSGLPTKGEEVEQGEQAAGGTAQKTDLDEDTDEVGKTSYGGGIRFTS